MIRIGTPEDLHHALSDLRALSMTTQRAIADVLGVAPSRIGDYEHGRRTPATRTVIRALRAMGWQLAIVPLIETAPETALSARVAAERPPAGVPVGTEGPEIESGASEAWPNGVRCPVVDDWCPGNADGVLCAQPCNPEEQP